MANFLKSLFVKGIEIDTDGATTNQVLKYNGTKFAPAADATGSGSGALDDLTDVVITSPEEFQGLSYNGTNWVNSHIPLVSYVQNAEATTITTGTCVYLFGSTGDHATVKKADNSSDTTSSKTIGVVGASIAASQNGPIVTRGYVDGIDLSTGYTAGDVLWLGTNGAFTKTKPTAPAHLVFIGVVVRATNNGIIYVATQNGYELDEIHNVQIDSGTLASGDFLKWNGTLWVNDPINLGTDTVGNYMTDVSAGTGITVTHTPGEGSTATIAVTANTYQPLDSDLTAVAGLSTTGLVSRTGSGTASTRTITAGTGITVTDGDGVSGNPTIAVTSNTYQPLDADLTAIAGLSGTSGLLKKTAADTWSLDTNTYLTSSTGVTTVNGSSGAISNVALTTGKLSQFAATSSSELAGVLSDETGSGALVFATSPSLTTPAIGSGGATFAGSSSGTTTLKASATASGTVTIPAVTGTLAITASPTLTNVTINSSSSGQPLTVGAVDGTNEGGDILLKGAGVNSDLTLDNFTGTFRVVIGSTAYLTVATTGTSIGTVTSGTWNGSTIAIGYGGTGATTATTARDNLGVGSTDNVTFNRLRVGDGTVSIPSFSFTNDTNSGFYSHTADALGFAAGGETVGIITTGTCNWRTASTGSTTGYQALYRNNTLGSYAYFTSSRNIKENITTVSNSGSIIDALRPVTFTEKVTDADSPESASWKQADIQYGFIAEEVAEVENGHLGQYKVDGNSLIPIAWKHHDVLAVAVAEIKELRARVAQLEAQLG